MINETWNLIGKLQNFDEEKIEIYVYVSLPLTVDIYGL